MDNLPASAQLVLDTITQLGQATPAAIREQTGKAKSTTDKAIRELSEAGLIAAADPGDGTTVWSVASDGATDPQGPDGVDEGAADGFDDDNVVTDSDADDIRDPDDNRDADDDETGDDDQDDDDQQDDDPDGHDGDTDGEETDGVTAGQAVELIRPARPQADRRVLAVRGVLGDYPDGATAEEIVDATGYNIGIVARLLQAMQQGEAAIRIPADTDAGTPERWLPGPGKASDVDPNPAPPRCESCGQIIRGAVPKATAATPRAGTSTVNADGSEALGRNVLRGWVLDFINAHPGHVLTPQTIADQLGAAHGREISSGAVRNNCTTLAAAGQIQLATESPLAFTANASDTQQ
jgi:hypothetical protein